MVNDMQMQQPKPWRMEAYNPRQSNNWITLWGIEEDQLEAAVELRNEFNRISPPVLLRVVRDTSD